MIHHALRLIYLHSMKTAGTSVRHALCGVGFIPCWDDEGWAVADQHTRRVPQEYADYKVFCTWRNPYERLVSFWGYYKRAEQKHDMPFGQWVDFVSHGYEKWQLPYLVRSNMHFCADGIATAMPIPGIARFRVRGRENKSEHEPWRTYYDPLLAAKVRFLYDQDFEELEHILGDDLTNTWADVS